LIANLLLVFKQSPERLIDALRENEQHVTSWRDVSDFNCWSDDEPPATDILSARLRAKYYGAHYVCTRPYLDFVLHVKDKVRYGERLEDVCVDARGDPRPNELALFRAIALMDEDDVTAAVGRCIRAAVHSTTALDGVEGKLIVTNPMGTAHA